MIVIMSQAHCREQAMDSKPKGLIRGQIDNLGRGYTELWLGAGFFVLTIKRIIEIGLGLQKNAQIVF